MAKSTQDVVVKILSEKGPLLSSALAAAVSDRTGVQNYAARKLISRVAAKKLIHSTQPVQFDRAYLYYLERHVGKRLAAAIQLELPRKPPFDRVFKTLLANRGYITRGQIYKATGCLPDAEVDRPGGRMLARDTIAQLTKLGLITPLDANPEIFRAGDDFKVRMISNFTFRKAMELEQGLFLEFREWIRRCYLLSWESHEFRLTSTDAIAFNKSYWDLAGPTFVGPFTRSEAIIGKRKNRQAFIVAEMLGYRTFSTNDAASTLNRLTTLAQVWRKVPFIPLILSAGYSKEALATLKESGIVPLTLSEVFGRNVQKLLRLYAKLMAEPSADLDEVDESLKLVEKVDLPDELATKLRGDFFELIVAIALKKLGFETRQQLIVDLPAERASFELDIMATKGVIARLIECKGRKKGKLEELDEIKRHFELRVRATLDPYGMNLKERYGTLQASYFTTGELNDEMKEYCERNKVVNGVACEVFSREKVLRFLDETGEPQLSKLVEKYF